jgi:ubiquinone/menaquinone biosynthesis C-methylase UbiE
MLGAETRSSCCLTECWLVSLSTLIEAKNWIETISHQGPWPPPAEDIVQFAEVGESDRVLDVGCGLGDITAEALSKGAHVVSVDFSHKYLANTARKSEDTNPVLAEASMLPFRDMTFDRVVSKDMWHNIVGSARRTKFIEELGRVTRSGGLVAVSAVRNKMYCYLDPIMLLRRPSYGQFQHYFMPSEVKAIFRGAKLHILQVKPSKMPYRNTLPLLDRFTSPWIHAFRLDIKAMKP